MAPLTAGDRETSVDWAQVRAILGLRWRVAWKGAARKPWLLALTVVGYAAFAAVLAALTCGAWFGMAFVRERPDLAPLARPALHALSLLVLVSLALTPALGLRGNEFLDVTKLFTFPVNHRTVFAATLLGLLTSGSVAFLTLPLLGAVAGFGGSPAEVAAGLLAAVLVALVGVALGQTGLLLFLDVFRSRKWRDLSRFVLALASAGTYAALRLSSGSAVGGGLRAALEAFDGWKDWLLPLPSWWGAHAVTGDGPVRWLPALALPVLLVWLVRVAAALQERAYFGEIEERREVSRDPGGGFAGRVGRLLPGALGAAAEKDLRVLLRDPTVRIQLIQQFAYAIVPLVAAFWSGRGALDGRGSELAFVGLAGLPVLLTVSLAMNPLGTEGAGLQHALLTPVPRSTLLLGKAIALALVLGSGAALLAGAASAAVALFATGEGAAGAATRGALAAAEAFALFAVFAGTGAVAGAVHPTRVVTRDRRALRQTSQQGRGCLGVLWGFAAMAAAAALAVPVVLGFHHPALASLLDRDTSPFLVLTVPAALLWGAFVAWAGSRAGGALLADREETVLGEMTRSPE